MFFRIFAPFPNVADLAVIYTGAKLPDAVEDLEFKRVKSASTDIDEGVNADDKKPKPQPTPQNP